MKKINILITVFVLPLSILCGLIVYRVSHPWSDNAETIPDNQLATASNPDYRKQQVTWLTNQFDPLFGAEDISDRVKNLPIHFSEPIHSMAGRAELHGAVDRVVQSLLAKTFDEYLALRSVGESILFDQKSVAWQARVLQRLHKVRQVPTDPMELHGMYWSRTMEDGKGAILWEAASWQASWVECRTRTKLDVFTSTEAFSESIKASVPNCGVVGYASSIAYGPTPKEVLSKDGHILTALAYILLKTSEGKAYPLVIQFYWAPSIRGWLPTHLAVGYVGNRRFDPVF